jgi:hypothetical protein
MGLGGKGVRLAVVLAGRDEGALIRQEVLGPDTRKLHSPLLEPAEEDPYRAQVLLGGAPRVARLQVLGEEGEKPLLLR